MKKKINFIHGLIFSAMSLFIVYILHHLPINQLFIDPFSEYIKHHNLMDISCSKFRDHTDPNLFDPRVIIINSEVTDRSKLVATIDFIARHQVKVIGVDLFFDSLYYNQPDTLLHELNLRLDNLVYAKNNFSNISLQKFENLIQSDPFLVPLNLQYPATLASDDGFTVRSFQPFFDLTDNNNMAFAVAISEKFKPGVIDLLKKRNEEKEWINFKRSQFTRFYGSKPDVPYSIPHYAIIGMTKFLEDTSSYEADYFKNKIVLIGYCNGNTEQLLKDFHFTPLNEFASGRALPDMNGVVIHANIVSMLLDSDYIYNIPVAIKYLLGMLIFFANYYLIIKFYRPERFSSTVKIRLLQCIEFILFLVLGIWLLASHGIKFSFVFIATIIALSFELYEFYQHRLRTKFENLLMRLKWI